MRKSLYLAPLFVVLVPVLGFYLGRYEKQEWYKGRAPLGAKTRDIGLWLLITIFSALLFGEVVGTTGVARIVYAFVHGEVISISSASAEYMLLGFCGLLTCAAYHICYMRGEDAARKRRSTHDLQ